MGRKEGETFDSFMFAENYNKIIIKIVEFFMFNSGGEEGKYERGVGEFVEEEKRGKGNIGKGERGEGKKRKGKGRAAIAESGVASLLLSINSSANLN